jgi:hypothetical protein
MAQCLSLTSPRPRTPTRRLPRRNAARLEVVLRCVAAAARAREGARLPSLYAFCRLADDAIDLIDGAAGRRSWTGSAIGSTGSTRAAPKDAAGRPRLCRRGRPRPRAAAGRLRRAARRPRLGCGGAQPTRRSEELVAYCARVAGTVGAHDDPADGRARCRRRWPAPATSGWRCSSPTSPATSARTRATGGSTCRWTGSRPRKIEPAAFLATPGMTRGLARVSSHACSTEAESLYRRSEQRRRPSADLACRPAIHAARLMYSRDRHRPRRAGP